MVHKFSDRADEQRKEAEVVRLRTPPRNIWIDLMTGQFCDPAVTIKTQAAAIAKLPRYKVSLIRGRVENHGSS